MKHFF
jgi:hypothetical protein